MIEQIGLLLIFLESSFSLEAKDRDVSLFQVALIRRHSERELDSKPLVRARYAVYGSICEQIRNKGFSTGMCCP